jgi:hypothetical protein
LTNALAQPSPSLRDRIASKCARLLYPTFGPIQVIAHEKDPKSEGWIYTAKVRDWRDYLRFTGISGDLVQTILLFPEFANRIGFSVDIDENLLRYADRTALNARITTGYRYESRSRLKDQRYSNHEYWELLVKKRAPYGVRGNLHFHDFGDHWRFLTLHESMWDYIASHASIFSALEKDPETKKIRYLHKKVREVLEKIGDAADRITSANFHQLPNAAKEDGFNAEQFLSYEKKWLTIVYKLSLQNFYSGVMYFPYESFRDRQVSAYEAARALLIDIRQYPNRFATTEKEKQRNMLVIDKLLKKVETTASRRALSDGEIQQAASSAVDSLGKPDFQSYRAGMLKIYPGNGSPWPDPPPVY